MHLDPHAVLPFVQLAGAGASGDPEMPMAAAQSARKLSLASNNKASPLTLVQGFLRRQPEVEFEHFPRLMLEASDQVPR